MKKIKNNYTNAGEISYQSCQNMGRCVSGIDEFIQTAPNSKLLKKPLAPAATGTKTKSETAPKI